MRTPSTLRTTAEFTNVLHGGHRAGANGVVVYAVSANIPDEDEAGPTPSRLGLVVRARNRAVVRSRIKRRIRAAFAACDPAPGFDVVVRVDERTEKMTFTDLIGTLSKALADCGVQIRRHGVPR